MGEVARASGSEGVHTGPLSRCATAPPSLTGQGSLFLSLRWAVGCTCTGCIVNTTCELVIAEIPGTVIEKEFDDETGYEELVFISSN